jgi:membrane protease YdiL (CAAX protease family)
VDGGGSIPPIVEALRALAPVLLALGAVLWFDRSCRRRRLDPPGFREPARRVAGLGALALALGVAVFFPLSRVGVAQGPIDYSAVPVWQLFLVHALLMVGLAGWWSAGYGGIAAMTGGGAADQLGLRSPSVGREIGLGLVFGIGAWFAVLATVVLVALGLAAAGGGDLLPKEPPAAIPWLAGQPLALRLGLALSAGVVEEIFFRGLLQPRIGISASTAMFALAHLAYDQPFLLVGVTLLSIVYGLLVRWRQNLWAAITAHFLFDAIQLAIVIPTVLRQFHGGAP